MKKRLTLSTGTLAALILSGMPAWAQDKTQPMKSPSEKDVPAQAEPAEKKAPEEQDVPIKFNSVSIGYQNYKHSPLLNRYAHPSDRLNLHELRLFTPQTETLPYMSFVMKGWPSQDSIQSGYIALNHGHTTFRGSRQQYNYTVADWRTKGPSQDNKAEFTVDHEIAHNVGAFVNYNESGRTASYPAPRDGERTRTNQISGGIGGKLLSGNLQAFLSERATVDDTGAQPRTIQRRLSASYSKDFGESFSLEGVAAYAKIDQAGLRHSDTRAYTVNGALDLGPKSLLQFQLGRQDISNNNVLNAHIRKRLVAQGRFIQRWPGWSLQVGLKHLETERIRADQSFVDVPKNTTIDGRLAGRIGKVRLTLLGSYDKLRDKPVVQTDDARPLSYDNRALFQAKLDGGGNLFNAYTAYTYRYQRNVDRNERVIWNNIVVGGSYNFNRTLNGYAEFAYDDFRVTATGLAQPLDFFFPNARSFTAGMNWTQSAKLSASASINRYENGDVRGTQLTMSLHHRIARDQDLDLVVAPWKHEDRLYNISGYETTFFMIRYTVKF